MSLSTSHGIRIETQNVGSKYPVVFHFIANGISRKPKMLLLAFAASGLLLSLVNVSAEESNAISKRAILEIAEVGVRAIYEERKYSPRMLRGKWLQDSSGYVVQERNPEGRLERVRYDSNTGMRHILEKVKKDDISDSENLSPDDRYLLYYKRGNIHLRNLDSGKSIALTHDTEDGPISNERAAWSPDGTRIAFVHRDESEVRLRKMLDPVDPSYPEVREIRFPRVGEKLPKLKVGVVNIDGSGLYWIPIPEPAEGYHLGQVDWAGNSDEVLVEKLSRFRNEREFILANVKSDELTTIYRESDPAWVVASYRKNSGIEWINGGKAFIAISEKDGWRHAYLSSRSGQSEILLTPGEYDIIERVHIDENRGLFYFNASPNNNTQKYLHCVPLDGDGDLQRITPLNQPGTHNYQFSPDARRAVHTYSNFDMPPVIELLEMPSHRVIRTLEGNEELRKESKSFVAHPTEFLQLDIGNGVVMDAWMIKPRDFDSSKKYPVFVYVYGEPHLQTVLDSWGAAQSYFLRVIADMGYLVVSIDNRGTPAPKGAAWRRAVFPSLGPLSTEEQAAGLLELARLRSFVDLDRVGIWGWSGGGTNTLNALFKKSEIYHLGIAVVPKPQPHLYNAYFQEIYMETRETNPEGYRRAASINYAEGLKGDLLIIHGGGETNTHLQIVEGLVDRLIELGKRFDYFVYPNRNHGLSEGKGSTVHVRMLIARYLLENLAPGPR